MSRTTEVAQAYERSKDAMLLGMGALAVTNPRKFARIAGKILIHYGGQAAKDTKFLAEIVKTEYLKPEVDYQKARINRAVKPGTIFTVNPLIPFVFFGGILVEAAHDLFYPEDDELGLSELQ